MNAGDERRFEARLDVLPLTAAFVEAFCARNGIARADALRLTLVVEELFTNTITHGYQGESAAPIRIALAVEAKAVVLLYEDAAPQHNPLVRLLAGSADDSETIGARPIGGLGILLVTQIAGRARYAYEDGCNRLWLTLPHG